MFQEFGWIHLLPLVKGAGLTIVLCFFATIFGSVIGLFVGLGSLSKRKFIIIVCTWYIKLIRGIPLLMLIFLTYFGLPMIIDGINFSKGFSAVLALSIYAGAYMGEIVRGSIQSISKGQFEASDALGLSYFQKIRYVILPQALKVMIPPGIGFIIALIKDSSLVSVIGYIDLTKAGRVVSNLTVDPIRTFLVVALFYFVICYGLSKVSRYYEAKLTQSQ